MIFRKRQLPVRNGLTPQESPVDLPPIDEQTFWRDSVSLLTEGFPNPNRDGCPRSEVLRQIATREMKLNEARPWLTHLGSCGSCFQDFRRFQQQVRKKQGRNALASVAALLLLCLVSLLLANLLHNSTQQRVSILDLRNYPILRGAEDTGVPPVPPLTAERSKPEITVYLPPGSSEGIYELQVLNPSNRQVLLSSSGMVRMMDQTALLHIRFNLGSLAVGEYLLAMHREGTVWSYYPLLVR